MKIHDYLKNNYGYSDFQIGQIRYTIISILSDVSKLIIMGIFFILTDYFFQYLEPLLLYLYFGHVPVDCILSITSVVWHCLFFFYI